VDEYVFLQPNPTAARLSQSRAGSWLKQPGRHGLNLLLTAGRQWGWRQGGGDRYLLEPDQRAQGQRHQDGGPAREKDNVAAAQLSRLLRRSIRWHHLSAQQQDSILLL
jgi:hypothetical protein